MDAEQLARQILDTLRRNGYPGKRVRLPYRQVYRAAVDHGFGLQETLEILQQVHRVAAEQVDDKLVFSEYVKRPPAYDSKQVDKHLRKIVRPVLKAAGFNKHKGRNSWRPFADGVAVVNFRSAGARDGQVYRVPSFSLTVQAGLCFNAVQNCPWETDPPPEFPPEHACHLRRSLWPPKSERVPLAGNIWQIADDGVNAADVVTALADAIQHELLPWLDRHQNLDHVLQRFLTEPQEAEQEVHFGRRYSPARANVICGICVARGHLDVARRYLHDSLSHDSPPATRRLQEQQLREFCERYPE